MSVDIVPVGPRRSLTSWKIAGLVIALMTPLGAVVGVLPLQLALGGPSSVLMYIAAAVVMWLFLQGYVQMVRRIHRPGGFFAYITRGLGKPAGVGTALTAALGYASGLIALFAIQPFITQQVLASFGISASWQVCAIGMLIIIGALAWRNIDLSAKLVGIVVAIEFLLLAALIVAIVTKSGPLAFDWAVLSPQAMSTGSWTVSFVFAILCYQGFESGALYAPEAKDPARSVPRGLYIALVLIAFCFAFVAWVLISISGGLAVQDTLLAGNPTAFVFDLVETHLGRFGLVIFSIFVVIAQVASTLSFTNFTARYLSSVGAEAILPEALAAKNRHHVPGRAVLILLSMVVIINLGLGSLGLDPYLTIAPVAFGVSITSATLITLLASVAVFRFFAGPERQGGWWSTRVAPTAASVLLVGALAIELSSFQFVTGSEEPWLLALPVLVFVLFIVGCFLGLRMRRTRPIVYAYIGAGDSAEDAESARKQRHVEQTDALNTVPAGRQ